MSAASAGDCQRFVLKMFGGYGGWEPKYKYWRQVPKKWFCKYENMSKYVRERQVDAKVFTGEDKVMTLKKIKY